MFVYVSVCCVAVFGRFIWCTGMCCGREETCPFVDVAKGVRVSTFLFVGSSQHRLPSHVFHVRGRSEVVRWAPEGRWDVTLVQEVDVPGVGSGSYPLLRNGVVDVVVATQCLAEKLSGSQVA